jgi:hypothetical protein
MGHSKTVCQCRGAAVPIENEEALIEHRANLVSAIASYIDTPVRGEEAAARDSGVAELANNLACTIREELNAADHARQSALRYRTLVLTLSELWRMGSDLGALLIDRKDTFSVFDLYGQVSPPRPWQEQDLGGDVAGDRLGIMDLTRALTSALPVAGARLQGAAARGDVLVAKHQASILGDLLDETTRVLSAVFRCHAEHGVAEPVAPPNSSKMVA